MSNINTKDYLYQYTIKLIREAFREGGSKEGLYKRYTYKELKELNKRSMEKSI